MSKILCFGILVLTGCATSEKPLPNTSFKPSCPTPKGPVEPGFVSLIFDVNSAGEPENIRIADSQPEGTWIEFAMCVAKSQRYGKSETGKAPPFNDHKFRLDMKFTE